MPDAVVVGAGHNGLVTANHLADAGWSVVVLEAAAVAGGAVQSAEVTLPGFVHDLYSTNQNGFLGGPAWAAWADDLRAEGLEYAHSAKPFANAFPDRPALRVHQGEGLSGAGAGDLEGWHELRDLFRRYSPLLFGVYGSTVPSVATYARLARGLRRFGRQGLTELAQLLLSSTRELGDAYFDSDEAKAMLACWGMHIDFGPDISGGSLFPFVECFTDEANGISIVRGGASRMIEALRRRLERRGGVVRTGAEVTAIETRGGRAGRVRLADGETVVAERAVIANVTPAALYTKLLPATATAAHVRRAATRYSFGPGTLMLHLALDGPVPWADPELAGFAYVHVGPYVRELAETYTDAANGILPASPLLVVGQSSVVDPSRAPAGKHVLWVQVRAVPGRIRGDRLGTIDARGWRGAGEPFADRVLAKLELVAPGVSERVLARRVITPAELEAHDANLVGGDNGAGSHHLRQNFVFRPMPGLSRYRTPVDGLWLGGAATWPGAGVTGVPGHRVAHEVLAAGRRRRLALSGRS